MKATIQYYFNSEIGQTVLSILKLLLAVLGINHVLACCWYAISNQNETNNWVLDQQLQDASTADLYLAALHWSITQFFCGNSLVVPKNTGERAFNVFVLFLTIMMSASIISHLTTSMTRLSIVAAEESQKFAALQDYLSQNNISARVALRVQRNARHALHEQKRHTPEHDIELLGLVSQPLRIELHYEVHMPALLKHPFFEFYLIECPDFMRIVCHEAISQLSLSYGDLLFSQGVDNVRHMYFLVSGKMLYSQVEIKGDMVTGQTRTTVTEGEWACEPVLWTYWGHQGSMRAKAESQLAILTAEVFQKHADNFKSSITYAQIYGNVFLSWMNKLESEELSDLAYTDFDYREAATMSHKRQAPTQMMAKRLPRRFSGTTLTPVLPHERRARASQQSEVVVQTNPSNSGGRFSPVARLSLMSHLNPIRTLRGLFSSPRGSVS